MKEELPSILISDGWETDDNDKLIEVVIPSTVEMYQAPTKVKFLGETLNWIPSTSSALQEIELSNMTSITYTNSSAFTLYGYTSLITFKAPNLKTLNCTGGNASSQNFLRGCTSLVNVIAPSLVSIVAYSGGGVMRGCTSLSNIVMPELSTISDTVNNPSDGGTTYGIWNGCTGLVSVSFPKLSTLTCDYGTFRNCVSLEDVQFGSEGHPVTSLSSKTFNGCTQSGLTITIYTTGGASLANEPWGATNATIVYEEA